MATSDQHDDVPDATAPAGSTPGTVGPPPDRRPRRIGFMLAAALLAIAAVVGVVAVSTTPTTAPTNPANAPGPAVPEESAQDSEPIVEPVPVKGEALAALPKATTDGNVPTAPLDTDRDAVPSGRIVHPAVTVAVYREPGGEAIASLPPQQFKSETWLPVIAEQPGWVRVMLPVRPAGATGWLYLDDPQVTLSRTPDRIVVDRAAFTLTLYQNNHEAGRWTVGVGKPNALTPQGRTFVLASIKDSQPTFSPVIMPLGTHSATYTSYGGGPGTVGLHTWVYPEPGYGTQSSDGCIRVPPDALAVLSTQVLPGTPVLIR